MTCGDYGYVLWDGGVERVQVCSMLFTWDEEGSIHLEYGVELESKPAGGKLYFRRDQVYPTSEEASQAFKRS